MQIEGPITNVGVSIHLGYKQKLKIQNKPNFGFLFNRAKHASQKFGFGLTETEIGFKQNSPHRFIFIFSIMKITKKEQTQTPR